MNAYPDDFVVHNLPLILLSGLESGNAQERSTQDKSQAYLGDGGFRIRGELSPLHHPLTEDLRNILLSFDSSQAAWRFPSSDKTEQNHAFRIQSVGRAFTLPPRKAPPPPHSPRLRPADGSSPSPLALHSTLSPLSPNSPLYPDGIITPVWITKHQYRLPCVLVSFYNLIFNANTSSLEDNRIKNEINNIRNLIASTNYKTKFVVVLVADGPINHTELEERLVNIRRGTNLDSKALYYLPSASSLPELKDFAKVLFSTLHPACIDYYRDLSKHARRKRNRSSVPPPTVPPTQGTSSVLPLQGWNVRYEFKLAVFAEFRQEMEAACRNYETAYEALFGPELLDAIPASSSRFDEAHLLADTIAIRIIRCFLWSSQTAAAVKWWTKHRDRVRGLIKRRGNGTANYGWEAWQSTWSQTMAELVERSEVFSFALSRLPPESGLPVQLPVNQDSASRERLTPWEHLHHEGYWLNDVRKHIEARGQYASQTTVKDPEAAKEGFLRAGTDSDLLQTTINRSIDLFRKRDQRHMVEMLQFYLHAEGHTINAWQDAVSGLKPLWQQVSWRRQGWWTLLKEVGTLLLRAAREVGDHELCLLLTWELAALEKVDAAHILNKAIDAPVSTAADLVTSLPQITPQFAFGVDSGHVGEMVVAQLSLKCINEKLPLGLHITALKIMFEGGLSPISITIDEAKAQFESAAQMVMADVELREISAGSEKEAKRLSLTGTSYWTGRANLRLGGRHNHVYTLRVTPREAGPVSVASIILVLHNGSQELTLNTVDVNGRDAVWWETRAGRPVARPFGMQRNVTTLNVLPRPPKLDVKLTNLASTYYTNENIELAIEVLNEEDGVVADSNLQVRLISPVQGDTKVRWKHNAAFADVTEGPVKETVQTLPVVELSEMASKETKTFVLLVSGLSESTDHELDVQVNYALKSDLATTLTKRLMVDLPVVRPFETNTVFLPRLHESDWPDFFAAPPAGNKNKPSGLVQKYLVRADIGSFAREELRVKSLQLAARRIVGGAVCSASSGRTEMLAKRDDGNVSDDLVARLSSEEVKQFYFDLEMQKLVLGDRQPVAIDFAVEIKWSRTTSEDVNMSTLVVPRFLAPMSEPRVLLQASNIRQLPGAYLLTYTIENPSMHFLTFNITMDGGEGIAFGGPKLKLVSLVPISRYSIHYRIYAQKNNDWANVQLQVLDAFFGQTLKIQPASDGVRVDKQGNAQIWLGG